MTLSVSQKCKVGKGCLSNRVHIKVGNKSNISPTQPQSQAVQLLFLSSLSSINSLYRSKFATGLVFYYCLPDNSCRPAGREAD